MEWEHLTSCYRRTKTPEGWLVGFHDGANAFLCYVPDPQHQWLAEEEQPENVA